MRFIKDGPDIPTELILSQERGDTVFFCGAGISYYLGLPGFKDLTEQVFSSFGFELKEEVSKTEIEGGHFDRILGALENSIREYSSRVDNDFRNIIKDILTVDESEDCY